ncbi:uncharacterized protein KGF55_003819 [Candida pseudojiufengensis]|uniref:uncharacterized protein n=1 Tax=Candida pseudojiufengensis TaxID=497109 RepID=UPI0022245DA0|nr:uncharacterized protein KGF55_003819 [Candida pseudojiufengensis]KAI5961848.1 hypothetical protein KGF55_003819 [Candida pseudojiufengensis]
MVSCSKVFLSIVGIFSFTTLAFEKDVPSNQQILNGETIIDNGTNDLIVVNASISELLNQPYNEKTDFSSNWHGLKEQNKKSINKSTEFLKNFKIEKYGNLLELSHNILTLIYGGNYSDVIPSDIKLDLDRVYHDLGGEFEKKWNEANEANKVGLWKQLFG